MRIPLAIVLKGYPRLSETFIAQEIRALEEYRFDITLFSLRLPTDKAVHPIHAEIKAPVVYLPEYLYQQPLRVIRSAWKLRKQIVACQLFRLWWQDFKRDPTANRIRRLGQAFVFASELPANIAKVYVHFLHTPASVTRYACRIRGIAWACSAHAKDIWTSPAWEITEKIDDCAWLTTCTEANAQYLRGLCHNQNKIRLNYHGLDLNRFDCVQPRYSPHDGTDSTHPVVILSIGRAVEKKGYRGLLVALSRLPNTVHWQFVHVGGGPLLDDLKQQSQQLAIDGRVQWLGPRPQDQVLTHLRQSDIFILNSLIDPAGDRDGLPNVLVEAQSQGLPVISTHISGIPELVQSGQNGLLVEPENTAALTRAIRKLITSPQLRKTMGLSGQRTVQDRFDMQSNHRELHQLLEDL